MIFFCGMCVNNFRGVAYNYKEKNAFIDPDGGGLELLV